MAIRMTREQARAMGITPPPRPRKTGMTGPEQRFAAMLEARKLAGEIEWYAFETLRLKLANRTTYTPDFAFIQYEALAFVECKGPFVRDDSMVKLKCAARMFPFDFYLYREHKDKTTTFERVPA